MFADGFKDQPIETTHHHRDGTEFMTQSHVGAGVHSTYETNMIDRKAALVVDGLRDAVQNPGAPIGQITTGKEAAQAIIELMDRSATAIPPKDLVDTYVDAGGTKVVAVQDALWGAYGDKTISVMADGARVLAHIWQAAWDAGNGAAIPQNALVAIDPDDLVAFYSDITFVDSLDLDHIGAVLA
jgi:hypothetical protein